MKTKLFSYSLILSRGFSLTELLVVMAILMLLAAVAVPSLSGLTRSSDMQIAATRTIEQFQLGRQIAKVQNRPVEMRIFTADKTALGAASIQLFSVKDDGTAEAAERRVILPNSVAFSETQAFSDFFTDHSAATNDAKYGNGYVFRFKAGGQPDAIITNTLPSLTIMGRVNVEQSPSELAPNSVTIQLEPQTGRPRVFRP
jgi:uncharacterized protein (TIGR02596 family)